MRIRLAFLPVAVLALAGCERIWPLREKGEQAATAPAKTPAVAGATKSAPAPAPIEQPDELPLEDLTGIWRVTGVVPDKGSAFARDDARIVGSLMDVLTGQISWSYKASDAFASSDVCMGPVAGIIDDRGYAAQTRSLLSPTIARLRARISRLSAPHQWLCGDGGAWGNDAEFQQLGPGRMAMRWTGDVTLILERVRQVSGNPPPLPPTGAYEGPDR